MKFKMMNRLFYDINKNYYRIPDGYLPGAGTVHLLSCDGEAAIYLSEIEAQNFKCPIEDVKIMLHQQWQDSLLKAKNAWIALNQFHQHFPNNEQSDMDASFAFLNQIFVNEDDTPSEMHINEAEIQHEIAENLPIITQAIPDVLQYFQGEQLNQAIHNPEQWAEAVYQAVYGKQEQKEAEQANEELRSSIRQTIRENLRPLT
jgi:hypothetical protein